MTAYGVTSTPNRPLDQTVARYERIIELSQQLNMTLDHVSLLRRIVFAAMELTGSEASSILLIDANTGDLRFELASNLDPSATETITVPLEGSIAGWVVSHGEARVIEDVTQESNFYRNVDDATQFRTRNILAVPMQTHARIVGALEALNKRDNASYDEDDIKILTTLAGQAALAIENARLFQQRDFMSEMVHELRNPLAALKTSLALLHRAQLDAQRREEIVTTMDGELERLIRLTTEYLDLARLESGRSRLEIAPFEIQKLILECVDVVASQAAARPVTLTVDVDQRMVNGDRGKIKQVLLNLLTNAIKYNRENGKISVTAYTSPRDSSFVEIAVSDTGMGISREHQKNMFQKFFRASEDASAPTGTGLGLAIARRIVETHGGTMWLESELGIGTTFYLTLPSAD